MTFKVVVIGGGTGDLCLAHGLHKCGVEVEVFERSRTRAERLQGYRVHINPTGARALHECLPEPLWEAFLATTGRPGNGFGFLTEQLKTLTVVGDNGAAAPVSAPAPTQAHHSVSRITLHQVLTSGLEGVVHFDKRFERYERAPNGTITCYFADGTTAEGDVLVGADGAGSVVRQQYLPHARRVDTDVVAVGGKYLLTPESKKPLPPRLYDGPNTVIPPRSCGMFIAPHEFDRRVVLADGIGGNDPGLAPDALFDNTSSYLMWAYGARRTSYPADVAELDGGALRDVVSAMIASWHPALRRMVAEMIDYGSAAVRASMRSAEQFVSDNVLARLGFRTFLRTLDRLPPVKRRVFADHGND
ncbi:MAG: FAD-dependent monooxygenase [Propionibacteriales bacterium]|nr:FAD-dependent monooxygenase [Propionibacteriales bacterium]